MGRICLVRESNFDKNKRTAYLVCDTSAGVTRGFMTHRSISKRAFKTASTSAGGISGVGKGAGAPAANKLATLSLNLQPVLIVSMKPFIRRQTLWRS